MKYNRPLAHPAGTAIAAVLVLAPLSAGAQTTGSQPLPPEGTVATQQPTVAQPAPTGPETAPPVVSPTMGMPAVNSGVPTTNSLSPTTNASQPTTVFAPTAPVVQSVPEPAQSSQTQVAPQAAQTNEPSAAGTVDTSPVAAAPARSTVERSNPVAQSQSATRDISSSGETAPVATSDTSETAGIASNAPAMMQDTPALPVTQNNPAPEQTANTADSNGAEWVLGLGAIALVGGLGALAVRRRKPRVDDAGVEPAYVERPVAPVAPATTMAPVAVSSASQDVEDELITTSTPTHASAFNQWNDRPAAAAYSDDPVARREAMIAERPSAANPFLTRRNRLRRANFLARHDGIYHGSGVEAPTAAAATAQTPSRADRSGQVTYRFSDKAKGKPTFKPKFS